MKNIKTSVYAGLKKKINDKSAVITVVGLGYVGLPIALEFTKRGFFVNGLDSNEGRISKLKQGVSYINDISSKTVSEVTKTRNFQVTSNEKVLSGSDVIIVCVPTPLRKVKEPDISFVVKASETLGRYLRKGQMIILESTTYPGTTREVILPLLEKNGLKLGADFYLAFSPERIDPGNPKYDFTNIPKLIGGFTKQGTTLGKLVYSKVVKKVIGLSTPESAEVTKLLENTFRIVNIGLINEFAELCHKLNIDVWEVIKAAETKPFGFMPFYPGPGIGGHCIPADPMYLSWKARKVGFTTKMIDLAAEVNRKVPVHIVKRIEEILKTRKKALENAKILLLGVTYKKDVNDLRESPALDILEILKQKKVCVNYFDPYIPHLDIGGIKEKGVELTENVLKDQDLVVVVTDHTNVDYKMIAENSRLIFDTRNVFGKRNIRDEKIIRL
ncbi:MAG: nucleotide sugar dehydrogenase [Candidatus Omnitrophota bacterium]|nr:nucleotide sugar dehydrogenase [Candidatus Omnitrophota bacterium]